MQIIITGHKMEITAPLRDYVYTKVGKLEEFFKNIQKVEVVLEASSIDNREKRQVAEIRAWMAGKKMVQSKEAGKDMYAAIDLATDEARSQIEKHKEMHILEQRRKGEKAKKHWHESAQASPLSEPVLVKLDRIASKPMNFDEATAELAAMGAEFLAFRNSDNNELNVIRKNNQGFDLLRPERELTTEEALAEMKKSGAGIILFNNSETDCPNVIFQRKSGNFGLIEPEI